MITVNGYYWQADNNKCWPNIITCTISGGGGGGLYYITLVVSSMLSECANDKTFPMIRIKLNRYVCQGVPYADPPVRFAPPEPKTPWTGDLVVTQYKPACTQGTSPFYSSSEDCLYLNVFAPNPKVSIPESNQTASSESLCLTINAGVVWTFTIHHNGNNANAAHHFFLSEKIFGQNFVTSILQTHAKSHTNCFNSLLERQWWCGSTVDLSCQGAGVMTGQVESPLSPQATSSSLPSTIVWESSVS